MRSDRVWTAWVLAVVGSFLALEVPALIRGRREPGKGDGTLSHWLRGVLGTRPGEQRRRRWAAGGAFGAFFVWLIGHVTLNWRGL